MLGRRLTGLLAIAALAASPLAAGQATTGQDPHQQMHARGATVMGFDQEKTAHHFLLYEDGGAVDVSAKDAGDAGDAANRTAVRSHLPHIAMLFGQGDFNSPMLVHDSKTVPGTATLARLKDRVTYKYSETPSGGRVDITTSDATALAAIHEFLKFQIADHKTGDPLTVRKR